MAEYDSITHVYPLWCAGTFRRHTQLFDHTIELLNDGANTYNDMARSTAS